VTILIGIAAVADFALAALLVAVSGFIFGSGPESTHGGPLLLVAYSLAVIACVVAPIAGFILNKRGKRGIGLATAWVPPFGALVVMLLPSPY